MKDSQEGFTLLEILLSIAVGGMVMGGIVTAIFQTLRIPANSSVNITALENIRNSARWISEDMRMAQTVNGLTLDWVSWYFDSNGQLASTAYQSIYQLVEVQLVVQLRRTYGFKLPGDSAYRYVPDPLYPGTASAGTRPVGSYISAVAFSQQGQMIYVTITSSLKNTSGTVESKTYRMYLQPKESMQQ